LTNTTNLSASTPRTLSVENTEPETEAPYTPGSVHFLKTKTDQEKATEYKNRLRTTLEEAAKIMDEAGRDGIILNFALGRDGFGLMRVQDVNASKPL